MYLCFDSREPLFNYHPVSCASVEYVIVELLIIYEANLYPVSGFVLSRLLFSASCSLLIIH